MLTKLTGPKSQSSLGSFLGSSPIVLSVALRISLFHLSQPHLMPEDIFYIPKPSPNQFSTTHKPLPIAVMEVRKLSTNCCFQIIISLLPPKPRMKSLISQLVWLLSIMLPWSPPISLVLCPGSPSESAAVYLLSPR